MLSIYQLKPAFQSLLRPLVRSCAKFGITANGVTLAAMLVSLALGVVLFFIGEKRALFLLLPLWMFLRMAFNAVDGMPHLRYLRAMFMEPGCDKCHGILGYKTGDMRGATGLNLPLDNYQAQIAAAFLRRTA